MFANRRTLFRFAAAVLVACATVGTAHAGWVTIKNDTGRPIVVQEVMLVNGKLIRGKPTKLGAGESFREFQNTPGDKAYEVFDATNLNNAVWSGKLNCKADSQSFSVATVQNKVGVVPVPEPKKN